MGLEISAHTGEKKKKLPISMLELILTLICVPPRHFHLFLLNAYGATLAQSFTYITYRARVLRKERFTKV